MFSDPSGILRCGGREDLFNSPAVRSQLVNKGVKWKFNLKRVPWWGGYFERLVQSLKRYLKKISNNAKVTSKELQTVLVEIEATLNSSYLYPVEKSKSP